jgi:anthranilate synthase/aminodeoxychorismate synthase-like glutamine amidotransferase
MSPAGALGAAYEYEATTKRGGGTPPRVFVVDNYDSFTYNLVQFLGALGASLRVERNDRTSLEAIAAWRPTHLLISPGPGMPDDAGISMQAIAHFGAQRLPVLGVCLGHQSIGQVYGGVVRRGDAPVHGKTADIVHDGGGVFAGLPSPFTATRYHSLVVDLDVPDVLEVTARTPDGVVMGIRHRELPVEGVQFHPESVLTVEGPRLLANFLSPSAEE